MFEPEPTGMGQDHESRLSTQKNGWFATKPTSVCCCAPPSQETRDRADRTGSLSRLHRSSFLGVRRTEERWKTQIRGYHVKPQEKLLQGVCLDFFSPMFLVFTCFYLITSRFPTFLSMTWIAIAGWQKPKKETIWVRVKTLASLANIIGECVGTKFFGKCWSNCSFSSVDPRRSWSMKGPTDL